MKNLGDETYDSEDGAYHSRNLWYGDVDMTVEGQWGIILKITTATIDSLYKAIKNDLSKSFDTPPTETNWYFYGRGVTVETIGENILPAIMVREKDKKFIVNISVGDHDFATNLETILACKAKLENRLANADIKN